VGIVSENYKRESDARLDEMMLLIREIHQRQNERTIPAIEKMESTLYGNGKKGLCEIVSEMKTSVFIVKWFVGLAVSLIGLFFIFLEFIFKHR